MLSIMSIVFDIIFLIQHFIIYPEHKRKKNVDDEKKEFIDKTQDLDEVRKTDHDDVN